MIFAESIIKFELPGLKNLKLEINASVEFKLTTQKISACGVSLLAIKVQPSFGIKIILQKSRFVVFNIIMTSMFFARIIL